MVGEEFAELEGDVFYEETWPIQVSGYSDKREAVSISTYTLRHNPPHQLEAEVDIPPIHSRCDAILNELFAVNPGYDSKYRLELVLMAHQ